ncbi:sensor histidine kinase [Neotamlana laminarinivorans]|uniref:histidine kinase n=1 Tax=Neotamlana laminarinivorans TaxID=2883124 RepID=A0A9X1I395_9FLAO|nr:HAMP domain-containing sensor histidine kinase [Tamlana laminarinivorans]MCB4799567.1 PAS domain S-box protein [Tamlana laminarinivorans]
MASKERSVKLDTYKIFESIFNYANGGIAIVSLKGDWIKVNDSIEKTLGYTKEELYKIRFQDITHKDDLDKDLSQMHALLNNEIESYQMEKRYFHKAGHIIWALLSVSLVKDELGKPLHFISQIHDISNQKSANKDFEVMLDVAKEQNSRLSNFANIITHNLRTHASNLEVLFGFIEEEDANLILKNDNFKYLKESILNLNETVSHLSEIAKIRAVSETKMKSLSLQLYVKNAIYNVSAILKKNNFEIVNNINPDHHLKAIPAYLDSIILNLITNSIKYRSKERQGKVVLSSYTENNFIVFSIKDNGIGIDLEAHGKELFQMYKTFHRNKDAIGLGLFITRTQVESMGGKITVESDVNIGTTFNVFLKNAETIL